eukprot:29196-Pelagococcus_subviridis.AAC.5
MFLKRDATRRDATDATPSKGAASRRSTTRRCHTEDLARAEVVPRVAVAQPVVAELPGRDRGGERPPDRFGARGSLGFPPSLRFAVCVHFHSHAETHLDRAPRAVKRLPPFLVRVSQRFRVRLVLVPRPGAVPQVERVEHHRGARHERVRVRRRQLWELKRFQLFLRERFSSFFTSSLFSSFSAAAALPQRPKQPVRPRDPRLRIQRVDPADVVLFLRGVFTHLQLSLHEPPLSLAAVPG